MQHLKWVRFIELEIAPKEGLLLYWKMQMNREWKSLGSSYSQLSDVKYKKGLTPFLFLGDYDAS